jgi:uncharacterized membrane protein
MFGIVGMWDDQVALEKSKLKTKYLTVVFAFCAFNLFVSMILTMKTSPGHIPEDTEWDMPQSDEVLPINKSDKKSNDMQL